MMGLMVLLALALLIAVAISAGAYVYRKTHRWWAFALATIIIAWLPFWDVVPGVILFHKTARDIGGMRVFKKVKGDGYLDRTCYSTCSRDWGFLLGSSRGFRYIEAEVGNLRNLLNPLNLE